jgi:hypothetical protein
MMASTTPIGVTMSPTTLPSVTHASPLCCAAVLSIQAMPVDGESWAATLAKNEIGETRRFVPSIAS